MAIDQGVERLRALEAAWLAGDIGRGKLRVLLRAATPATEDWWLARSRTRSARELEDDVRDVRAGTLVPMKSEADAADNAGPGGGAEAEVRALETPDLEGAAADWTRISLTGTAQEQAAWRVHGVEIVRLVCGESLAPWKAAEYVAANALAGGPGRRGRRRIQVRAWRARR